MRETDEWVLAVPTAALWKVAPQFHGLRAGGADWIEFLFGGDACRYLPRAQAEQDPAWKQIIPYVVLCHGGHGEHGEHGGKVAFYQRGRGSTETRLAAMHSVGFGGHVRAEDVSLFAAPGWASYRAALRRELDEELELAPSEPRTDRLVGLINDDTIEVGRVHLGLVHIWDLAEDRLRTRERKIVAPRLVSVAELATNASLNFETWSRFCLASWDEIHAQPGWVPQSQR